MSNPSTSRTASATGRPSATATAASIVSSPSALFLFWVPLGAQWFMMALEGPFLAAVIARMADPTVNLAAYGVAFAFAILVEAPVIMLMSASTALVEDGESYRKLRNFATSLNIGSTLLLLLLLIPLVYRLGASTILGVPPEVASVMYGALWLLLPWPAAIGFRRFLHGVLIRSGQTRRVAYGTILRLGGLSATALVLYLHGGIPGAWVGAAALSAGVCVEALATAFMAAGTVRQLRGVERGRRWSLAARARSGLVASGLSRWRSAPGLVRATEVEGVAEAGVTAEEVAGAEAALPTRVDVAHAAGSLSYGDIARFYYPLALTALIGLSIQPLLTFFMGRAASPLESLAVFPVVHALSFLFRAPGFSYQEAVIALVGRDFEHARPLIRFGVAMALLTSGLMALVAFTPLAAIWFETVSGLPPELAQAAVTPTRILVPLPALAVALAFLQAVLVRGRTTRAITAAAIVEVAGIAVLFAFLGLRVGMFGASAAMLALLGGRTVGAWLMLWAARRLLASRPRPALS
jgi:Na+-driven multidrug efflux pump